MSYSRDDVERSYHQGNSGLPMVNVKDHGRGRLYWTLEEHPMGPKAVERAIQYAWECHAESFWESIEDRASEIFGRPVKVYSEGRSGGWLVVKGLPDVETWDAIALGRWRRFEKETRAEVDYLTGDDALRETIDANGWLEIDEGSPEAPRAAEGR